MFAPKFTICWEPAQGGPQEEDSVYLYDISKLFQPKVRKTIILFILWNDECLPHYASEN